MAGQGFVLWFAHQREHQRSVKPLESEGCGWGSHWELCHVTFVSSAPGFAAGVGLKLLSVSLELCSLQLWAHFLEWRKQSVQSPGVIHVAQLFVCRRNCSGYVLTILHKFTPRRSCFGKLPGRHSDCEGGIIISLIRISADRFGETPLHL